MTIGITITTTESWAEEEFQNANLGDVRRTERLIEMATTLGENPTASLPEACCDAADLKATYRFFDNNNISPDEILKSHTLASINRLAEHPIILAVQDTTYLDWTAHPATDGLGPLASEFRQGLLLHSTIAFTPGKVPLGLLQQQVWARDPETYGNQEPNRPIEQKESFKWIESIEAVNEIAKEVPDTNLISVGDREADVYDFFIRPRQLNVDFLIRASWDRRVEHPEKYLWNVANSAPVVGKSFVEVTKSKTQEARTACLTVRTTTVKLRPPKKRKSEKLPKVTVSLVYALEENPPAGSEQLEWLLITTVTIENVSKALECLGWYTTRWGIEVWHRVLKSGCHIEKRQLQTAKRLKRALSVYSVIAWRVLYATMLSRECPNLPCTVLLEEAEWQVLYCVIFETKVLPYRVPTLREAVRWIASLGGFLGRKSDGEPGPTVLWRGFRRLADLTFMYLLFS
jgi:hypothetical protein